MIGKMHRFHGYGSLKRVYRDGQTVRGPLFSLKYLPNTRSSNYRLAVVVSRKVHKSAVVRNRIRRRSYEAVRLVEDKIKQPHDIVITVFHDTVAEMPSTELHRAVKAQMGQAGII